MAQHAFQDAQRSSARLIKHLSGLACQQVPDGKALADPPLLRLEGEACHAYLSMLLHLNTAASEPLQEAADVERRLMQLCIANLRCFQVKFTTRRANF